jgi:hypothetical protein
MEGIGLALLYPAREWSVHASNRKLDGSKNLVDRQHF